MGSYLRPKSIDEALSALRDGAPVIVAGGTDFYPARVGRPIDDDILDISGIAELRGITADDRGWRIGATTTWTDLAAADLPPLFDGLRLAAREVGGMQIQNAGTICGNLCNASPAADGVPPLLALGAAVELSTAGGRQVVPLESFITGSRQTARRPEELVTAVLVPRPKGPAASTFRKLGARRYLVISIVMVAAAIELDPTRRVAAARIVVGACSAVAQRLPALEAALVGQSPAPDLGLLAEPMHLAPLTPIDDVRGSAAYRQDAALVLVRRALNDLGGRL